MVKRLTAACSILFAVTTALPAAAQKKASSLNTSVAKPTLKFLDGIEISTHDAETVLVSKVSFVQPIHPDVQSLEKKETDLLASNLIESATTLQLKYAVLLNTEVEQVENTALFSAVDEWYGTRYELGGSTKAGIDCSAFVQAIYAKLFQIPMPRTAKEQYKITKPISRTELKQGDLVFFHTRGSGVSHVGIYLQNNKFVHAASSGGVMVSDLFEDYWVKRFVGVGRYETSTEAQSLALHP